MSAPVRGAHTSWFFNNSAAGTSGNFTSTGGSGTVFSMYVGWYGGGAAPTITDNKGNNASWVQVGSTLSLSADTNEKGALFECVGGTGGSSHTVTVTFSGTQTVASAWLQEWTGLATTSPRDKAPGGNSATASPYTSLSTGTTSQADEVVLAYCSTLSASGTETFNWTANSFTATGDVQNNANADQTGDSAYRIVSATGNYQASFTSSGAGTTAAVVFIVTYKGASSGSTLDVDAGTDTPAFTDSVLKMSTFGRVLTDTSAGTDSTTIEKFSPTLPINVVAGKYRFLD